MDVPHYLECHITIDPVDGPRRMAAILLAEQFQFKIAKLLLDKGKPSQLDTFMTGHSKSPDDMKERMLGLLHALKKNHFVVRRYKIENIVLDSRIRDEYGELA